MYQHRTIKNDIINLPVGKVVCVGRNYADHIREMGSKPAEEPLLFLKPREAICSLNESISVPVNRGACHNELEVALLIGETLKNADETEALAAIAGVGVGLDLTLRDIQQKLKSNGEPWDKAKGFDLSCPVSGFCPVPELEELQRLSFSLDVNGERRQTGNTADMIYPVASLLAYMSRVFTLSAGDIVMTGTPKGVGPLIPGDKLNIDAFGIIALHIMVVSQ